MKKMLLLIIILTMLSGCAENGYATDSIARVYHSNIDGCVNSDGYTGWAIQLRNDHPTDDSRNQYQIRDSLVSTAQHYADTGERVRVIFNGSNWDSDCDRVVEIQQLNNLISDGAVY